jgi:UDP-N-acetylglucosamine 4-epimerase
VRHSLAGIDKARRLLGYEPSHRVGDGLREAIEWYVADLSERLLEAGEGGTCAA